MPFQVVVQYPNGEKLTFPFHRDEITCGRAEGNDIRLAHGFVSSRHFRIRREDGAFFVEDTGSTNGTTLNARALEANVPQRMTPEDVLGLGSLEIRIDPIVDATVIERISRPVPAAPAPPQARPAERRPVEAPPDDVPAPVWQVQTGMIPRATGGVRIDDQSVSFPRRDAVGPVQRPGLEERLTYGRGTAQTTAAPRTLQIPWGALSQLLGGLLLLLAVGVLVILLLS